MTNIKTPDLTLTGSLLVAQYNEMCATAADLGLTAKEVNRFSDAQTGAKRTEALHQAIQKRAQALKDADEEARALEKATGRAANTEAEAMSRLVDAQTKMSEDQSRNEDITDNSAGEEAEEELTRLPDETEEDYMARKAAAKKARAKKTPTKTTHKPKTGGTRAKSQDGTTIREMTEAYNEMVPAARKAGVAWAKHHTSNFESKEKAQKQIDRLKDAMKTASK